MTIDLTTTLVRELHRIDARLGELRLQDRTDRPDLLRDVVTRAQQILDSDGPSRDRTE